MTASGPRFFVTKGHLLLCQNQNCMLRGADTLYRALWSNLEQTGLAYYKAGGGVRLTKSGCLGACKYGPALLCYRSRRCAIEEAWYAAADFALARAVAQAIHEESDLPQERRYGP